MAQNTKSLVRRQAHDIILAQQIHYACPISLVFHDLTSTNMPTIAPNPRLDPKKRIGAKRMENVYSHQPVLQWLKKALNKLLSR